MKFHVFCFGAGVWLLQQQAALPALSSVWVMAAALPVLLFTGPLLVITLALIGRTTQARTQRRERELAWLDGHFLDMVRGLPTLRLFGRADEQAATIDDVVRRLASSSLDVLRTAFQTSLVLEWGATAATALVAILVSVRLMAGDLTFERALAVLLLTPECFVPVRQLASQYHVRSAGRVALESIDAATATAAGAATGAAETTNPPAPSGVARKAVPRSNISSAWAALCDPFTPRVVLPLTTPAS